MSHYLQYYLCFSESNWFETSPRKFWKELIRNKKSEQNSWWIGSKSVLENGRYSGLDFLRCSYDNPVKSVLKGMWIIKKVGGSKWVVEGGTDI